MRQGQARNPPDKRFHAADGPLKSGGWHHQRGSRSTACACGAHQFIQVVQQEKAREAASRLGQLLLTVRVA
jgi:hypothetical protein